jgi:hypothetical protein
MLAHKGMNRSPKSALWNGRRDRATGRNLHKQVGSEDSWGRQARTFDKPRGNRARTKLLEARIKVTHEVREHTRDRIAEAFAVAYAGSELRGRLRAHHIDLHVRRNEGGRITGSTFIDHENRNVFNGSWLGKEYSANALQERFGPELESGAEHREDMQSRQHPLTLSDEIRQPVSPEVVITPFATLASETQHNQSPQKRIIPKRKQTKMGTKM